MAYVVLRDPRVSDHNHPTYVHTSRDAAEGEAKRLAANNRGTVFFVCQFVSSAILPAEPGPTLTRFEGGAEDPWDAEIPF